MRRWKSKVDVKGHRSYVVAPGSRHKTGRLYTASGPISRDVIASLPEFPLGKYEALLDDWRRMPKPGQPPVVVAISKQPNTSPRVTSPRSSRYEQKAGDPTQPIPSPTPSYTGRLPLDVAAELGTGSQVEIGCPFRRLGCPGVALDT